MTYRINKTDGSVLADVNNGAIDQISSDLTLVGSDFSGYGEFLNENFVWLLENFANSNPPTNPIKGQLWYDTGENRLKIYNGTDFVSASAPIVKNTTPFGLSAGDIWINPSENQMSFFDGTDLILVGPVYKSSQGLSGFVVESISDTGGAVNTVVKLYSNDDLIGFVSNATFNPVNNNDMTPYDGGTVTAGLTLLGDYSLNLNGSKIKNMSNPLPLMMDVTNKTDANIVTALLSIAPVAEYPLNTLARVWCYTSSDVGEMKVFERTGSTWTLVV